MKHILLALTMIFLLYLLTGCSINDIRDQRAQKGCYVLGEQLNGMYLNASAMKKACWCSKDLPEGFKYKHDDGQTACEVGQ